MKKIILAAVIAATTTGSVSAATIYEGKGLKYELKGDFQLQLRQKVGQDKDLDDAIAMWPKLIDFISQSNSEKANFESSKMALLKLYE